MALKNNSKHPDRYFPPDLIPGVLSRLPVKSLLRFRCVSKSWRFLIESSDFVSLHLDNYANQDRSRLIFLEPKFRDRTIVARQTDTFKELMELEPVFEPDFKSKNVRGYVNGLMLISSDAEPKIRLLNISTRRWIRVLNHWFLDTDKVRLGLAFVEGDHKVVGFVSRLDGRRNGRVLGYSVDVYSVRYGFWKSIVVDDPPFVPALCHKHIDVFVNGAIHWIGYDRRLSPNLETTQTDIRVIAFDVASETLQYFEVPNEPDFAEQGLKARAFLWGKSLALLMEPRVRDKSIWVMEDYGRVDSWIRKYTFPWNRSIDRILYLEKNDQLLLCSFWNGTEVRDVKEQYRPDNARRNKRVCWWFAGVYVESLALFNETKGHLLPPAGKK